MPNIDKFSFIALPSTTSRPIIQILKQQISEAPRSNFGKPSGWINNNQHQSTTTEKKIFKGQFTNYFHGISGDVYFMGDRLLLIENFKYDGTGPDAFFWVGTAGKRPASDNGILLAHPFRGKFYDYTDPDAPVLRRFSGETPIVLTLPDGVKVTDLKWISVWCRRFRVNFGDLLFQTKTDHEPMPFETTTPEIGKIHLSRVQTVVVVDNLE